MNEVIRLHNGWYSFVKIPQGYFKIDGLNCGDDKTAIKQARRIIGDKKAVITITEVKA